MDIGGRAKKILHAVVSEYLATGEAVGSQTVTRRYGLDVSAATVRNVMGDLEEVGLLKHTHTSGGRIPTDRGLRYYVDTLLRVRSLTAGEKDEIRERFAGRDEDAFAVAAGVGAQGTVGRRQAGRSFRIVEAGSPFRF